MPLDVRFDQLSAVEAPLNYLVPMKGKPVAYNYEPPPGVPRRTGEYRPVTVRVHDMRPIADQLSLDVQGFAAAWHDGPPVDYYDPVAVERVYYPEMERFVKTFTGAQRVRCFDHIVRFAPRAETRLNGIKEPAKRVHNDYTETSGPQRVRDLLPEEAETLLRRRFAVINVWRPLHGPLL